MIKNCSKISHNLRPNDLKQIGLLFALIDRVEGTSYFKEFYYAFVNETLYSLEDLADYLNTSLSSLQRHLKKINLYINKIIEMKNEEIETIKI